MKTYYFKPKNCKDKFASLVKAATLQEAVEHFAKVKRLPIEVFEKLYEVKPEIN